MRHVIMENLIVTALPVVSRDAEVLRSVCAVAESNLWQLDIAASAWDAMEKLHANIAVDS
jgi:hypothetical protein